MWSNICRHPACLSRACTSLSSVFASSRLRHAHRSQSPGLRLKEELSSRIPYSPNLHKFLASPDPQLDIDVEYVTFAGTRGQEEPMQALFNQLNAVGQAVRGQAFRRVGTSEVLSVPVSTSEEPVTSHGASTQCSDVVHFCFHRPHRDGMEDDKRRMVPREGTIGSDADPYPTHCRRVNQVLAPGETKGRHKAGAAARQIFRRFYRIKSTIALRGFVYAFTLAEDGFRVLFHIPGGIMQTNEFNSESAANVRHEARLWEPIYRNDAMTGSRAVYYPGLWRLTHRNDSCRVMNRSASSHRVVAVGRFPKTSFMTNVRGRFR
ncbi:BQ5605_C001g00022 [Microbotryum silenes-dioicae]|uniref:BQ5605_C001g00022 protein n=1 Tax=Microbotryum silenes-dioicae TaxID=796604 RepID=A0A2X0MPG2_9BASI|nr:BQ5605_C001g00022 [Microbotryum silenes-dioicae]